jgi:ComF family protein
VIKSASAFPEQLLFPPCCYLCSAILRRETEDHLRYICRRCLSLLPFNPALTRTFPALANEPPADMTLPHWRRTPVPILFSVFLYEGVIRELILGLKFGGRRENARLLGSLMAAVLAGELKRLNFRPAGVVPMPLGYKRHRRRGYNQSELLADFFAAGLGLEVLPLLVRSRETARQSELKTLAERKRNVQDAFAPAPGITEQAFRDRQFILVDDVLTSGYTMLACAGRLQAAGADVISLVAASGTGKHFHAHGHSGD